jgi:catechol 2,3-dioxygenase-like lactoylglutathione lyase family enzyme
MKMQYKGTLIAVKDIEKSKQFYKTLLGLEVIMDAGANAQLTGGVFLQTADTWIGFINKKKTDIVFDNNAMELYFETDDMDIFNEKIKALNGIDYLHQVIEHSWGQRAVRFYDSDRHIIEVAESIGMVIKRFIESGLTEEQTAKRMDVDVKYIIETLAQ